MLSLPSREVGYELRRLYITKPLKGGGQRLDSERSRAHVAFESAEPLLRSILSIVSIPPLSFKSS